MASRERDRDRELLIPVADSGDESSKPSSSSSSSHHAGRENAGVAPLSFIFILHRAVGLGFITSVTFIFLIGVFMSSWLGASVLSLGEWFIKRMPFVRHIYNASKQISAAISPDQNTQAFKEVAIIRHPRIGEYAFGFITSSVVLQNYSGEEELCCVYVPTNHLYIGDIFLINTKDVIRPNLSVREGIEIVVSGGMSMPQILSTLETRMPLDGSRPDRR
ncbi:protein CONTINUOUS VASCULAR RING 1 [Citrus sinensis]|nr:protein CONTINUOUS VASCULAR RING 1 [Citrus sinensis]